MRYLVILALFLMVQQMYSQDTSNHKLINDSIIDAAFKYQQKLCSYHLIQKQYKVLKIRHLKSAYLIDLTNPTGECFFTIISLKSKGRQNKQIKKGKTYIFKLNSYYPYKPNVIYVESLRQSYFEINGVTVYIPNKYSRGTIVTTPNLKGLYYIPPEQK